MTDRNYDKLFWKILFDKNTVFLKTETVRNISAWIDSYLLYNNGLLIDCQRRTDPAKKVQTHRAARVYDASGKLLAADGCSFTPALPIIKARYAMQEKERKLNHANAIRGDVIKQAYQIVGSYPVAASRGMDGLTAGSYDTILVCDDGRYGYIENGENHKIRMLAPAEMQIISALMRNARNARPGR